MDSARDAGTLRCYDFVVNDTLELLLKKFKKVASGEPGIVVVVTQEKNDQSHVVAICRGKWEYDVIDQVASELKGIVADPVQSPFV